jgi:hypothetical protein
MKIRLSQFLLEQDRLEEAQQLAQSAHRQARQHLTENRAMQQTAATNLAQVLQKMDRSKAPSPGRTNE